MTFSETPSTGANRVVLRTHHPEAAVSETGDQGIKYRLTLLGEGRGGTDSRVWFEVDGRQIFTVAG